MAADQMVLPELPLADRGQSEQGGRRESDVRGVRNVHDQEAGQREKGRHRGLRAGGRSLPGSGKSRERKKTETELKAGKD